MDQTVTTQAWMRGNVGGLRGATKELGLRSPRCFIKQLGNKISECFHCDAVQHLKLVSPFLFSPLRHMANALIATERVIFFTPLSATAALESKIQMSGSEHYPLLSSVYRWLAVQFCSSAELNPNERFLGSKAADLAQRNVPLYLVRHVWK